MTAQESPRRYFIKAHQTSFALEIGDDPDTISYYVVADTKQGNEPVMLLLGNVHRANCEIVHQLTEPFPCLALDKVVMPLFDQQTAREVADHLDLPMPTLPAGLVTQAGQA